MYINIKRGFSVPCMQPTGYTCEISLLCCFINNYPYRPYCCCLQNCSHVCYTLELVMWERCGWQLVCYHEWQTLVSERVECCLFVYAIKKINWVNIDYLGLCDLSCANGTCYYCFYSVFNMYSVVLNDISNNFAILSIGGIDAVK